MYDTWDLDGNYLGKMTAYEIRVRNLCVYFMAFAPIGVVVTFIVLILLI